MVGEKAIKQSGRGGKEKSKKHTGGLVRLEKGPLTNTAN